MAATLSSSGTWTSAATDFTDASRAVTAGRNDPHLTKIAAGDLRTPPSEATQIVQLVADGYTISFWPAAVLLRDWLTSLINQGAPTT